MNGFLSLNRNKKTRLRAFQCENYIPVSPKVKIVSHSTPRFFKAARAKERA